MSDVLQLILNTQSQGAAAPGPKGDAGTDGFAQLFDQQMNAEPVGDTRNVEVAPGRTDRPLPVEAPVKEADAGPPERDPLPEPEAPGPDPVQIQVRAAAQVAAAPQPVAPPPPEAPAPVAPEAPAPVTAQPVEAAAAPLAPQVSLQAFVQAPAPQLAADLVSQGSGKSATAAKAAQAATPAPSQALPVPSAIQIPVPAAPVPSSGLETDAGPEPVLPDPGRSLLTPAAATTASTQAASGADAAFIPEAAATGAALDAAALAKAGLVPLANPVLLAALAPATGPTAAALTAMEVPALSGESPGGPTAPGGLPAGASAPRATQADMIARMVAVAKLLSKANGDKTFLLKLNPPDLGRVQVRLQVEHGMVEASVHTETHAARHAILQNLEQLKASLLEQGLQLGRFDVSVEGQDAGTAQFSEGQGGGRRRTPEEELADSLAAVPGGADRREDRDEESGEVPVSDAMAVDLLA